MSLHSIIRLFEFIYCYLVLLACRRYDAILIRTNRIDLQIYDNVSANKKGAGESAGASQGGQGGLDSLSLSLSPLAKFIIERACASLPIANSLYW